jgi:hypothetical protein
MKDKKIIDICLFCGNEPYMTCWKLHPKKVREVMLSDILTKEEMKSKL